MAAFAKVQEHVHVKSVAETRKLSRMASQKRKSQTKDKFELAKQVKGGKSAHHL